MAERVAICICEGGAMWIYKSRNKNPRELTLYDLVKKK